MVTRVADTPHHPLCMCLAGASASAEALPRVLPGAAKALPTIDSWDQERQRTFAVLQPICSLLLLQRGEPQTMAELLAGEWWR